jgi:CBS domain-containing protein
MTREVRTCAPDDSLNEAALAMWDRDCGFLPVVDEQGILRGVVTDRDICMAALFRGASLQELRVRDAMSRDVEVAHGDEGIEDAEAQMRRARVHRLPVVDAGDRVVGVITLGDLARAARARRGGISPSRVGTALAEIHEPRTGTSLR